MSNPFMSGRRSRVLTVAAALGLCLVANGQDPDPNTYGPNDRPVFAFISVTDTFALPTINKIDNRLRNNASTFGSPTICLKIGTFFGGDSIETSRFLSDGPVFFDPLAVPVPPGTTGVPGDFVGNHMTMIGSFKTLEPDSAIHLMTPYPQAISAKVQAAYFNASVLFETGLPAFPSTVEVALFIFDHQGGAGATINEIMQEIFFVDFGAPVVLGPPPPAPAPPILTGEGDFFPHTPGSRRFSFDVDFDLEAGVLDADVCLDIAIDVKPGNAANILNLKSDTGVLSVAVLKTSAFDANLELDPDTVVAVLIGTDGEVINEVKPERFQVGNGGVTYKFSVRDLVDGPNAPLTTFTTILTLRGETFTGMCVQGSDTVTVVPKSK